MPAPTQSDLFSWSGLPQWLPDETLFSWCSRFHALSGNLLAASTCTQLFGHRRLGAAHDLPSRIAEFATRTGAKLGAAEQIIHERTLLPFYLPFRSAIDAQDAISSMKGNGIGSLKFRLGILTSRFGANHPLRACSECMEDDLRQYGIAYWHRSHQYPGAVMCLKHHAPLQTATEKSNGVGRFLWSLPTSALLARSDRETGWVTADEAGRSQPVRVTQAANQLATLPLGFHFDARVLLDTYHLGLADHGLSTSRGKLKHNAIGASYLEFLLAQPNSLQTFPPLTQSDAAAQVLRLLRTPRSGTHPLRHVLIICWLFGSWETFWWKYCEQQSKGHVPDDPVIGAAVPPAQSIRTETEKEVIRMVCKEGISVTSAATRANIDVATAMTFLAKAELVISRRPKKLKTAIRQSLVEELKNGADRKILARKYEVSQSTIAKVLAQEFGLQLAWSSARSEQTRATSRADWQALVTDYPHIGIKQLREKNQKIYAWLYRNDRSWLVDSCRQLATISQPRRSLVDWRTRDLHLANAVLKAAKEIAHKKPGAKILLWKLYQRVPQLKTKLSSLHKLPLTKEVIDQLRMDSTNTDADGGLF